jgi:hypothetical protein
MSIHPLINYQTISEIYDANDKIRQDLKGVLANLSDEQINILPDGEKWTVAGLVEHIAIVDEGKEVDRDTLLERVGDDESLVDALQVLLLSEPRRTVEDPIDTVLHDAENCVFSLRNMAIANRVDVRPTSDGPSPGPTPSS